MAVPWPAGCWGTVPLFSQATDLYIGHRSSHAATVHRYQQRRRSQGHSAAAVIDGGRDDAACLPNMCVSGCLDGRGCATGIGATRHGQPSTLRWQAVRPPHANDRRLGGPRAPAARFCRRAETSSGNTISQARVQPRPQLASAAVAICRQRRIWSEHWTVATVATLLETLQV
jgi:hypothetical protein